MATEPLPSIEEGDYDAVREIAPDLPDTYAGWQRLLEQEKRERGKINPVQLVPVGPAEFEAYCKDRGVPGSSHILLRFAIDYAGPHEVEHDYDPHQKDGD